VQGNQPTLERELAACFPVEQAPHHVTFDRGHGRTEIREITTTSHVADIDFPGVFQAVRIRRETRSLRQPDPQARDRLRDHQPSPHSRRTQPT
jgi:hypothetical protein